ncbi:hypothetical protein SJDPG12_06105 [Porphyromonas gingivalis SJD12]|uniref:hypothetical protein n=1 Tax=Porphyromonas gingivalis TaxID=837 RepID=UPI000B513424|nr:hypothetical protein [Porphyromonas gingivalis]MCE8179445.1 hypothetical protein [Porphyromonas gingivalis]OWR82328.1 hypothetical protein SJDPG12_06105 [Porphyromonas gingivalis SJD12]
MQQAAKQCGVHLSADVAIYIASRSGDRLLSLHKETGLDSHVAGYPLSFYISAIFFNFERKTSGIKNLQLNTALSCIEIELYLIEGQKRIANQLSKNREETITQSCNKS